MDSTRPPGAWAYTAAGAARRDITATVRLYLARSVKRIGCPLGRSKKKAGIPLRWRGAYLQTGRHFTPGVSSSRSQTGKAGVTIGEKKWKTSGVDTRWTSFQDAALLARLAGCRGGALRIRAGACQPDSPPI